MRSVLSVAGAAFLFAGPAVAADLAVKAPVYKTPPVPVYSWTGCYAGAIGGGESAKSDVSWAPAGFTVSFANTLAAQTAGSIRSTDLRFTGGGEVGCNYQFNPWLVVGVEGDGEYTGLSATRTGTFNSTPTITDTFTQSFSSHWLATVRGRVGVASGQWLFFASGGAAFAKPTFSDILVQSFAGGTATIAATSSGTITGWTAGGGIEWLFLPHLSLKAEYLHVDFGTKSFTGVLSSAPMFSIGFSHNLTEEIGRVGLNYHF